MHTAHELILLGGVLGLVSILGGLLSTRFGAPILLAFLVLGMLAGEDGPGGIEFSDFTAAYLVGSVALAVILFDGGLKTERRMLREGLGPAALLATVGVALSAGIVGGAAVLFAGSPWLPALIVGAAVAPTDAAAVATLLRQAQLPIPHRVLSALEVESGLNDPMSVFLTVLMVTIVMEPAHATLASGALLFLREMVGGTMLGVIGGYGLRMLLRRVPADSSLAPILILVAALTLFGAAQVVEASGFLAVYIAGFILGAKDGTNRIAVSRFFETFSWLAQVVLFLMLGLLVTPHQLIPILWPSLAIAATLMLVARPVATFACLIPFRFTLRETAFVSWVGLRGAVPIYLTLIPVLSGVPGSQIVFGATFVIVIASLVVQGWTIGWVGRLLGFRAAADHPQA